MKKQLFFLLILVGITLTGSAQHEYRLSKSTGTLKINLNNLIIEGYDGKDIIFSGEKSVTEEVDERAKGLSAINSSGYTDNTGLGISVTENAQEILVKTSSRKPVGLIKIKVPKGLKISILENNNLFFSTGNRNELLEIVLKNLKNEIEISVYRNKIKLENNTGPMNVKTISGSIEALFSGEIVGPISLISVADFVDVTLPTTTKANIEISTSLGKIYAAKEFNIDFEKQENNYSTVSSFNSSYLNLNSSKDKEIVIGDLNKSKGSVTVSSQATVLTGTPQNSHVIITKTDSLNFTKAKNPKVVAGTGAKTTGNFDVVYAMEGPNIFFGGGERVKGKLNGGGADFIIKSNNKSVYLRTK